MLIARIYDSKRYIKPVNYTFVCCSCDWKVDEMFQVCYEKWEENPGNFTKKKYMRKKNLK